MKTNNNPLNLDELKNSDLKPLLINSIFDTKFNEESKYLQSIVYIAKSMIAQEYPEFNIDYSFNQALELKSIDIVISLLSAEEKNLCQKYELFYNREKDPEYNSKIERFFLDYLNDNKKLSENVLLRIYRKFSDTMDIILDLEIISKKDGLIKEGDAKTKEEINLIKEIKCKYRNDMLKKFKELQRDENLSLINIVYNILNYLLKVRTEFESKRNEKN